MYYFLVLSAGMIAGYIFAKRKNNNPTSSSSSQEGNLNTVVKFIGKRSAVVDIGKGVKLFVPVSVISSKFSGRIRLSLEKKNNVCTNETCETFSSTSSAYPSSRWIHIHTKIIEYPISDKEICLFPPFTIQNKILTTLAIELVTDSSSIASEDPEKVLQRYVVTDAQRYVNLFPLGWWHISVEEVIKNQN
jgi:hypothetical protein